MLHFGTPRLRLPPHSMEAYTAYAKGGNNSAVRLRDTHDGQDGTSRLAGGLHTKSPVAGVVLGSISRKECEPRSGKLSLG